MIYGGGKDSIIPLVAKGYTVVRRRPAPLRAGRARLHCGPPKARSPVQARLAVLCARGLPRYIYIYIYVFRATRSKNEGVHIYSAVR